MSVLPERDWDGVLTGLARLAKWILLLADVSMNQTSTRPLPPLSHLAFYECVLP